MRRGDRIDHETYGPGLVLETEGSIVRILWDYPELGKWPGEAPRETFWTDISDVFVIEKGNNMLEKYFVLVWDHKHGQDLKLYSSYDNAKAAGVSLMREVAEDWGENVTDIPDDILWRTWPDIAGDTEYFSIEELELEDQNG